MKVVTSSQTTLIFPFVSPDGQDIESSTCLVVYHQDRMIKIIDCGPVMMSAEAARTLAEALLHAVEISQGRL